MAFADFQKSWTVYGLAFKPKETVDHKVKIDGTAANVTVKCLQNEFGHPYGNGAYQGNPEQITGPNYVIKLNGKGPQGKDAIKCEPAPQAAEPGQTPSWTAEDRG